jgi:hypothetical protein
VDVPFGRDVDGTLGRTDVGADGTSTSGAGRRADGEEEKLSGQRPQLPDSGHRTKEHGLFGWAANALHGNGPIDEGPLHYRSSLGWEHNNLTGQSPLAQQRQNGRGHVQAATAAATGLAYDFFRFLRRPQEGDGWGASLVMLRLHLLSPYTPMLLYSSRRGLF